MDQLLHARVPVHVAKAGRRSPLRDLGVQKDGRRLRLKDAGMGIVRLLIHCQPRRKGPLISVAVSITAPDRMGQACGTYSG